MGQADRGAESDDRIANGLARNSSRVEQEPNKKSIRSSTRPGQMPSKRFRDG